MIVHIEKKITKEYTFEQLAIGSFFIINDELHIKYKIDCSLRFVCGGAQCWEEKNAYQLQSSYWPDSKNQISTDKYHKDMIIKPAKIQEIRAKEIF